ncbi:hypothetical protein H5410_014741 [Solanum commersonii]|uniref:Uncharacterized protein n=1 Tax=Solanum commersonii TaxID=4109 RepID=A0A9J5ZRQ1_SOLCO|nr:hypothetical protein H5410_014741 [Solanum commersonii]
MCLYIRTCIFGSNDAYSFQLESATQEQSDHDGRGYGHRKRRQCQATGTKVVRKRRRINADRPTHRAGAAHRLATSAWRTHRQPWPSHESIGRRSAGRHRPCDARQKLEASAKACTHLTSHVRIGQTTSAKGSGISRGLHSSTVACEHRLGDIGVGQWHAASNKAWTHLMWHVCGQALFRQRQRATKASHTSDAVARDGQTTPPTTKRSPGLHSSIVRSLHTSISLPTLDVACPHYLLLALVKQAASHAVTLVDV